MTASKVGLVALPVVWMALVTASPNAEQTKSVVNGVYTEAQATRGAAAYKKDCSSCHGEGLELEDKVSIAMTKSALPP